MDTALRIARSIAGSAAAASLLLCLFTLVLWALSYGPLRGDDHGTRLVFVKWGALCIGPTFPGGEIPRSWEVWNLRFIMTWSRFQSTTGKEWTSTRIALWFVALLLGLFPAYRYGGRAAHRVHRKRRARKGRCPGCGYDLRGTAADGRCPECGVPKSQLAAELKPAGLSPFIGAKMARCALMLCLATAVLWALSFNLLRGDHDGVTPVFVADGKLWVGAPLRDGEESVLTEFWNLGFATWARHKGVRGAQWTSWQLDLLFIVLMTAIPPAARLALTWRRGRPRSDGRGRSLLSGF